MKVYVNDEMIVVFEGATVKDALNKYTARMLKGKVPGKFAGGVKGSCRASGEGAAGKRQLIVKKVFDGHGNRVMTDGSLSEDDHIYFCIDPDQ